MNSPFFTQKLSVSIMLTQFSLEEISQVNDSSMLTLLKYSTSFDEVIWALSWEAESVAGIGVHKKNYLTLFIRVCLLVVLALFDLIFLFDQPWAFAIFLHKSLINGIPNENVERIKIS